MNNLRSIFLVILSMLAFSLEDMFIKQLSVNIATGQVLLGLGIGSSLIFFMRARLMGDRILAPAAWRPMMLMRALSEGVAAMFFATALARVDISTVAAVFQTMPLVLTMAAAFFLHEQVGWRRWSAIGVGFAGVLLIIRPGLSGFEPDVMLVLGAVFAIAARDLITRRIDAAVSSNVVSLQGFLSLIITGVLMMVFSPRGLVAPTTPELAMFTGAILFGAAGYLGIVTAMRMGEASVVAPYRYTRLVFSMLAGVLVFGERPDLYTLLGSALIIGSGLYTFLREQRLVRRQARHLRSA